MSDKGTSDDGKHKQPTAPVPPPGEVTNKSGHRPTALDQKSTGARYGDGGLYFPKGLASSLLIDIVVTFLPGP